MKTTGVPVYDKAYELGATYIRSGISWTWADGFTQENAKQFVEWLEANRHEHRGIYPPGKNNDKWKGYAVRFRYTREGLTT